MRPSSAFSPLPSQALQPTSMMDVSVLPLLSRSSSLLRPTISNFSIDPLSGLPRVSIAYEPIVQASGIATGISNPIASPPAGHVRIFSLHASSSRWVLLSGDPLCPHLPHSLSEETSDESISPPQPSSSAASSIGLSVASLERSLVATQFLNQVC